MLSGEDIIHTSNWCGMRGTLHQFGIGGDPSLLPVKAPEFQQRRHGDIEGSSGFFRVFAGGEEQLPEIFGTDKGAFPGGPVQFRESAKQSKKLK